MEPLNVRCSGFPILIPSIRNGDWMLYEKFSFWVDDVEYTIPEGFITDFASVSGVTALFILPWGRYGVGSIIHDFCYRTQLFDRKTSDLVFKHVMDIYNTQRWRINVIFYSVRLFGWISFNRSKKRLLN